MNEREFREKMAELGFYEVFRITDTKVSFEVVNFDFECRIRTDFSVIINKNGKLEIYDNVSNKLPSHLKAHEDFLYSCNLNLMNINKAFELIKEFYFEK